MTTSPPDQTATSVTELGGLPGFRDTSLRPPTTDRLPPTTEVLPPEPNPSNDPSNDPSGDVEDGDADERSDPSWMTREGGSFPGSTADPGTFVPVISLAFGFTGMMMNGRLAPEGTDVWIPSEEEVAGVAEPLSRILARHIEVSGDASDLSDGIEAAAAATAYTVRNVNAQRAIRAAATPNGEGWRQQQEQQQQE